MQNLGQNVVDYIMDLFTFSPTGKT